MNLGAWSCLASQPGREVLVAAEGRFSAGNLWERACSLAWGMLDGGARPGDRVLLALPNGVDLVTSLQASFLAGLVPMPLHPRTSTAALDRLASALGTRHLYTVANLPSPHLHRPAPPSPALANRHRLALLLQTSGSSGQPKQVMLSHENLASNLAAIQGYLPLGPEDTLHCGLPLSFGYGLYQLLQAMVSGARLVLDPDLAYPALTLERLAAERVSVFPAVPTTLGLMMQLRHLQPGRLPALHTVTCAGAALAPTLARRVREVFAPARLLALYGLTECQRVSWCDVGQADTPSGSVGRGLPHLEMWLEDGCGNRLAPGMAEGELVIRGPSVMLGYWPEADPGDAPRTLRTGDLVHRDAKGWLFLQGRRDEVFKSRGEKVSPIAVEAALLALPQVQEAVVAGQPDPLLGQQVVARLVLRPGASLTQREVVMHCRQQLPAHQVPGRVEFFAELPKTPSGKLIRSQRDTDTP